MKLKMHINLFNQPTVIRFSVCLSVLLAIVIVAPGSVSAQRPRIQLFSVFPLGGQQGSDIDIQITSGADLDDVRSLVFTHSGIKCLPATDEGDPKQCNRGDNRFRIAIGKDVEPGRYEVRAIGRFGISNSRTFVVSDMKEVAEEDPNNTPKEAKPQTLNSVVNGRCQGGRDLDCYAFDLEKGQRVFWECWAERIDSRLDATLVVFDPSGKEVARNRNYTGHDPLIDFTVPANGRYVVQVHDFLYNEGAEYGYRFVASTLPRIDFIFPPAGLPSEKQLFTAFGRALPGGVRQENVERSGTKLESLRVEFAVRPDGESISNAHRHATLRHVGSDTVDYRFKSDKGTSNVVPIGVASAPVVVEHEPNDDPTSAQQVVLPCEFVGQFSKRGDRDWVTFDAVKGEVYWVEAYSQRHGSTSDPFVLLQRVTMDGNGKEQIKDVVELDDSNQSGWMDGWTARFEDPVYRFQVPASGTYRIMIRDLYADARGGPHLTYRLSVRRPRPDFRLLTMAVREQAKKNGNLEPASPLLRRGGKVAVHVFAIRKDGLNGPIHVSVEDLPKQVTYQPAVIAAGTNSCVIVLKAIDEAVDWCGPIRIVGETTIDNHKKTRVAQNAGMVWTVASNNRNPRPARLASRLMLAVTHEREACSVQVGGQSMVEAKREAKIKVPVKIARGTGAGHPVTLTPYQLPPNVKSKDVTIPGDKSEGEVELEITKKASQGDFTIALLARTQLDYRKNQAAVDEANDALAKAKMELETADNGLKQIETQRKESQDRIAKATQRMQVASQEHAAVKSTQDAVDKHALAMVALVEAAQQALAQKPNHEPLKAAVAFATRQAENATEKQRLKNEELAAKSKEMEMATSDLNTATEGLGQLDNQLSEAQAKRKAAQEASSTAQKRAKEVNDANKPQKKDVALASNSFQLKIK